MRQQLSWSGTESQSHHTVTEEINVMLVVQGRIQSARQERNLPVSCMMLRSPVQMMSGFVRAAPKV